MNKQCVQCSKTYKIEKSDQAFYLTMQVPPPTLCPDCRFQRRLVWRNSRYLYKRICDLCKQEMIGVYSPDKPYTVYCQSCYYSDRWDATSFGREFDFSRPFFEQFDKLMHDVPHVGTNNQECDGSAYVNLCWKTTNSYLCFGSDMCDESYYCTDCYNCRSSFNSYMSSNLELSSYCVDCNSCYNTHYSQECDTVRDSYFCFDMRSSSNCFGSAGLRNKEYYIFNKPVPKDQWHQKVQQLLFDHTVAELYEMTERTWSVVPRKAAVFTNCENVSGDHLQDSANATNCYDCKEVTNVKYVTHSIPFTSDTMDVDNTGAEADLMYEFIVGYGYNMMCCSTCYNGVRDLRYCYETQNSADCFGSIGLNKNNFCILNTQYSEAEYKSLTARIIEHMSVKDGSASGGKQTGEWGEFFPISLSPFAYNETEAQIRFPLSAATIKKNGWKWKKEATVVTNPALPVCSGCEKNYIIIKQEQKFLDTQQLPQPSLCPDCRFTFLFNRRNPYKLWTRQCMCTQPDHNFHEGRCLAEFETTYSPERKELIYCLSCYNKEIL